MEGSYTLNFLNNNVAMRIKELVASLTVICSMFTNASAQELEYKYEIGGLAGTSFYLGDVNTNKFYKSCNLAGGAMLRYNINPRMSLKFNLAAGGISGDANNSPTFIPERTDIEPKFSNTAWDLGCQYEISFWGYGTGKGFKGTKRLVPYIQLGAGFTYCNELALNFPFGVGVKYKLAERLNIGLDWTMRFATSDKLDGIKDPYRIKSGFLKNKDTYCWTMMYVSYDICPKLRKCNND